MQEVVGQVKLEIKFIALTTTWLGLSASEHCLKVVDHKYSFANKKKLEIEHFILEPEFFDPFGYLYVSQLAKI